MALRFYDAHNHLQHERFAPYTAEITDAIEREGIVRMVVNGTCEEDWPRVLALANAHSWVLPSFGCHPWSVGGRTPAWRENLTRFVNAVPSAIGEIGLDRGRPDPDPKAQEEVFLWQWQLAREKNLPVSIHCLKAWGWLTELLRDHPGPQCGFVLHSYGGSAELISTLTKLGAYFSLPGYFAHERKVRQRECFRHVPRDRLLIETDAPDQLPPPDLIQFSLQDNRGPLNHPANLRSIYSFAATYLNESLETLSEQVETNFLRLFGGVR